MPPKHPDVCNTLHKMILNPPDLCVNTRKKKDADPMREIHENGNNSGKAKINNIFTLCFEVLHSYSQNVFVGFTKINSVKHALENPFDGVDEFVQGKIDLYPNESTPSSTSTHLLHPQACLVPSVGMVTFRILKKGGCTGSNVSVDSRLSGCICILPHYPVMLP